ncbi:MAG: molecular chaperone GrpE [Candidatus Sumerlaeota bacterium]|nr:molecular chaperone GrpE [Candidatus Sumerlaeota bacterium]
MSPLRKWLWKGSYEPAGSRLEVWEGPSSSREEPGLLERTAEFLAELGRLAELAQEMERRQEVSSEEEVRNVVRSMLPVLDALDRVLEYAASKSDCDEEFANWVKTVEAVSVKLTRSLEKVGLTPLSAVGTQVDLDLHDVVEMRPSREYPEGTVIEERQKGYYFRGRLLRDAKVVVALPR